MIAHVYERAKKSTLLDDVIVAVDSKETVDALKPFNIPTVMTDPSLSSGTDRVFSAIEKTEAEIIINIQGDEPLIEPWLIDQVINVFEAQEVEMATAVYSKLSLKDIVNPNVVKAFLDEKKNAIAFKREIAQGEIGACYRHVGIYGFRRNILEKFVKLPQSQWELDLHLEQLRALENGINIRAVLSPYLPLGVDTKEDLEEVINLINSI